MGVPVDDLDNDFRKVVVQINKTVSMFASKICIDSISTTYIHTYYLYLDMYIYI